MDERLSKMNHETAKKIPDLIHVEIELFEDRHSKQLNDMFDKQAQSITAKGEARHAELLKLIKGIE